jgi:NADH dehydrogenase
VPDHPGVWALGDCAEVPKPGGHGAYAPTAQNATREGKQVARNIVAAMHGQPPQPFQYQAIGELAIVGKRSGVAKIYGRQVSGITAWLMWRAIYLAKLPSLAKRVHVGLGWLLDAVFGLDPVAVRPQDSPAPGFDGHLAGTSHAEATGGTDRKGREKVGSAS